MLSVRSAGSREESSKGREKYVIDLSAPTAVEVAEHESRTRCRGLKLRDLRLGERLGARRDGGDGFQGCNSRVFRVSLRRPEEEHGDRTRNDRITPSGLSRHTATPNTDTAAAQASSPTAEGPRVLDGLVELGGQLLQGSFGACFNGNNVAPPQEDTLRSPRAGSTWGNAIERPKETEYALKMALTYRGQDPAQAEREMATEIAVLVGGRIPPHENIMRGVESFQDEIGRDLRPLLWAGLGPEAGDMLSFRTTFLLMPLFTAGSLQALLNKRRLRCRGPPFLRLFDAMRFLEQMLSAVQHLLAYGLAHNDIKPDNWLLRDDQRTLVLTDFGACVDSSHPPSKPPASVLIQPQPTITHHHADRATNAVENHASAADNSDWPSRCSASAEPASRPGAAVEQTHAPACPCPAVVGGEGKAAAGEATGAGGSGKRSRDAAEGPPSGCIGEIVPAAGGSNAVSGCEKVVAGNEASGAGGSNGGAVAQNTGKRRRCSGGKETGGGSGGGGGYGMDGDRGRGYAGGESEARSAEELSEDLVFPFSEYFVAGTPSCVAPELAKAWRERTVLDFRRSDIFSVGVCVYHMLRLDSAGVDVGAGLPGKGPLGYADERLGEEAWPLPLFPYDKGGCPVEVAQLCRGLLHPNPSRRLAASEGHSLAVWLLSRLEAAEARDREASSKSKPSSTAAASATAGFSDPRTPSTPPGIARGQNWESSFSGGVGTGPARSPAGGAAGGAESGRPQQCMASGMVSDGSSAAAVIAGGCHGSAENGSMPPMGGVTAARSGGREEGGRLVGDVGGHAGGREDVVVAASAAAVGRASVEQEGKGEEEECSRETDELIQSDRISHMRDFFASAAPEVLFQALRARGWDVPATCAAFGDINHDDTQEHPSMARIGSTRSPAQGASCARGSGASSFFEGQTVPGSRAQGASCAQGSGASSFFEGQTVPGSRMKLWFEGVAEGLKGRYRGASPSSGYRETLRGNVRQGPYDSAAANANANAFAAAAAEARRASSTEFGGRRGD